MQHRFLQPLAQLLPPSAEPIIVADSGFKVPFFREVERLGWRLVGRVRRHDCPFVSRTAGPVVKRSFAVPPPQRRRWGGVIWVRSNPLRSIFVLVRLPKQRRQDKTAASNRARSKKSKQAARSAHEPWLLVASGRFAHWPAKRLVRVYRQRMQIEPSFRDMKSEHFGEGLERSAASGVGRFTVLVLIASLAAILLWLIGTAAERAGLHQRLRPGSRKRRAYSRLFLARLLLTLEHCKTAIADLLQAVGPLDQWVASDHDSLLAE